MENAVEAYRRVPGENPSRKVPSKLSRGESRSQPLEILIIEDNRGDVELLKAAFEEWENDTILRVVEDGEEALSYVFRAGQYTGAARPNLIILDLNLPKRSGTEVLATLKASAALRQIPVVVLTTSDSRDDVSKAYELHANCYVTKPVDMYEFFSKIRALEEFWFTAVRLPFDAPPV